MCYECCVCSGAQDIVKGELVWLSMKPSHWHGSASPKLSSKGMSEYTPWLCGTCLVWSSVVVAGVSFVWVGVF